MKKTKKFLSVFTVLALFFAMMGAQLPVNARSAEMVKVIISFHQAPGQADETFIKARGGKVNHRYKIVSAIAGEVPESAFKGLRNNPKIKLVEKDIGVYAHDIEFDNTWGVERIGTEIVHNRGNQGLGVKVAILDSGIDYNHSELDEVYKGGYDFVNIDIDPMDDAGHGTHVAGTIAAEDNGINLVGVAPKADIYALKVLDGSGSGDYADTIAALEWAVENEIDVVNLSLGSLGDPGVTVKDAFDSAYNAGLIIVASAGNDGRRSGRGDNVGFPARYESVIAVAATDINDNRASFSSTGPAVEISAPGVNILSTYPGDLFAIANGTSMASPHVAGTVALMLSAGVAPANVRGILQSSADDLGVAGLDALYGYGLVDADEASYLTVNQNPIADAGGPYVGTLDELIYFDGSASSDSDGDILIYSWDFGDGNTAIGELVSHSYDTIGTYYIALTVTDNDGATSSAITTASISEANNDPVADAGGSYIGDEDAALFFDGSASSDEEDGNNLTYSWDFGDSSPVAEGMMVNHVYALSGTYFVSLTVTDSAGATNIATTTAIINEINDTPIADAGGPYSGDITQAIMFDGSASQDEEDGNNLTYSWNFGDLSSVAEGMTVSHVYALSGNYSASLTVTDSAGASNSVSVAVAIEEAVISPVVTVSELNLILKNNPVFYWADANIKIVDKDNQPVAGVMVLGQWSGVVSSLVISGITDINGLLSFKSPKARRPESGSQIAFTINDVVMDGYDWNGGDYTFKEVFVP